MKWRHDAINRFQNNEHIRVAILSLTACSQGITLHAAQIVIFLELYWTPSLMVQAEDRIHRLGQKKNCHCYYLYCENTFDEKIWKFLSGKFKIVNKILDQGRVHGQKNTKDENAEAFRKMDVKIKGDIGKREKITSFFKKKKAKEIDEEDSMESTKDTQPKAVLKRSDSKVMQEMIEKRKGQSSQRNHVSSYFSNISKQARGNSKIHYDIPESKKKPILSDESDSMDELEEMQGKDLKEKRLQEFDMAEKIKIPYDDMDLLEKENMRFGYTTLNNIDSTSELEEDETASGSNSDSEEDIESDNNSEKSIKFEDLSRVERLLLKKLKKRLKFEQK